LQVGPLAGNPGPAKPAAVPNRLRAHRYGVAMAVQPVRHRFSVEEYHRMAEAGVFGEDDRIELLDGEIVEMAAIGSHHPGWLNRLNRLFVEGARGRATVAIQNPVIMSPSSEPEPDVALLRPREDDYTEGHPTPEDLLLLVEVADTTVAFDR